MKSKVEEQMRCERTEFERQKAEYERKISDLEAKFFQLTANTEKVLQVLHDTFAAAAE